MPAAEQLSRSRALGCAALIALAATGCGRGAFRGTPCLFGPTPHVGRPVPDEEFALMRRELARAGAGETVVGAHILERLPRLFPDVSDLATEPECSPELVDRMTARLERGPLDFSRATLARIRSVGGVADTTDVMEAKARFLMRLVDLRDDQIPPYRFLADETGPAPPKSTLKYLALAMLAGSNVYSNVPAARRFLDARLRAPRDDREALLLESAARQQMEDSLWGHPAAPASAAPARLLRRFIADSARRLGGASNRISLEVVLSRLWPIGEYADRFGLEPAARALVDRIAKVDGNLPLTRGIAGGAQDLAVAAVSARADLDRHPESIEIPGILPRPKRVPYDAFAGLLSAPREHVKVAATRARLRVLAGELRRLRFAATRCYVIAEQAAWVPDREAATLFEAMTAPIFDARGRVRLGKEMLCRAATALAMSAVPAERRIALALRLLRARPNQILPFDLSNVDRDPGLGYYAGKDQVPGVAAAALADHLDWVDSSPELRAWLGSALATRGLAHEHGASEMPGEGIEAAQERLVTFDLEHGRNDAARVVLTSWIAAVRDAAGRTHNSVFPIELATHQLYALGELAPRAGLGPEIRALLAELPSTLLGKTLARPIAITKYLLRVASDAACSAHCAARGLSFGIGRNDSVCAGVFGC